MRLKKTANQLNIQPQIYYAIGLSEAVYAEHGFDLVVTCLNDSHESRPNSLHNKGLACDVRTRTIPTSTLNIIYNEIKLALDKLGYDIVLETDHIHIEYQPKVAENWIQETE